MSIMNYKIKWEVSIMKLIDLFSILSEHDYFDVYRDNVLVAQYDGKYSIDEIYNDSKVIAWDGSGRNVVVEIR